MIRKTVFQLNDVQCVRIIIISIVHRLHDNSFPNIKYLTKLREIWIFGNIYLDWSVSIVLKGIDQFQIMHFKYLFKWREI